MRQVSLFVPGRVERAGTALTPWRQPRREATTSGVRSSRSSIPEQPQPTEAPSPFMAPFEAYRAERLPRRPFAFRPAFSPDGRRIAFTWGIDDSEQIYMMNTDGSHSIRLTSPPGNCDFPSFSPDGRKIAFQSDRDGSRQIYVMDAEGTHVTRLTNPPGENGFPVFSP